MSIKDMVSNNKKSSFMYYHDHALWYKTECGFEFPVPTDDIGNATFNATEKSLLMMRYIRKHLKLHEQAQ